MKHKLTANLGLKFLSLVVAFVIWLLIVNIDNPIRSALFRDVKIQVANEDSVTEIDKVFDITSAETVVLRVTERRSVLQSLSRDDFVVTANMEDLNEMNSVPLTVTCSNPNVTWDEIQIVPSSMQVQLEQKKQSEFVVNISVSGQPGRGFEVGRTEVVDGKTVQIAGPESMLNRISQVVASVDVSRVRTDQRLKAVLSVIDKNGDSFTETQMSRLQVMDANGVLLSENTVLVDVSLWEVRSDIPIQVEVDGTPAPGCRVAGVTLMPTSVSLAGTPEALKALDGRLVLGEAVSAEGRSDNFNSEFDLTETLADYTDLKLAAGTDPMLTVSVQIERTGDRTLDIPLSNLEVLNRPEEMVLTFSPADVIPVSIHGEVSQQPVTVSDIRASIDLGVCEEAGTYTIPVEIELPEGYTLISDVNLVVTATEQEPLTELESEDAEE